MTATKTPKHVVDPSLPKGAAALIPAEIKEGAAKVATRPYWMGTLPNCPKSNVTLAGRNFNRKTGDIDGKGGQPGELVNLSKDEVKKILKRLGERIAKPANSKGYGSEIYKSNNINYVAAPGDMPLAQCLYLIPLDLAAEIVGSYNWRHSTPPSVLEMLTRGDEEQDWLVEVDTSDPKAQAAVKELEANLADKDAEIERLRAQLAGETSAKDSPSGDPNAGPSTEEHLAAMTIATLTEYAEKEEIDLGDATRKADIIDKISEAWAEWEAAEVEAGTTSETGEPSGDPPSDG